MGGGGTFLLNTNKETVFVEEKGVYTNSVSEYYRILPILFNLGCYRFCDKHTFLMNIVCCEKSCFKHVTTFRILKIWEYVLLTLL